MIVRTPETAIVDAAIFRQVQTMRDRDVAVYAAKPQAPMFPAHRRYVLGGVARCCTCGVRLSTTTDVRGEKRMKCNGRLSSSGCPNNDSFSMRMLERVMLQGLKDILDDPALQSRFVNDVQAARFDEEERVRKDGLALDARIEVLNAEIDRGVASILDDPRLARRIEQALKTKYDELDALQLKRRQLPTTFSLSFAEAHLPTLSKAMDSLLLRAPLEPRNIDEQHVKAALQRIVREMRVRKTDRFMCDVEVVYDLSGGMADEIPGFRIERHFPNVSSLPTSTRGSRIAHVRELVEDGLQCVSDEEFAALSSIAELRRLFAKQPSSMLRAVVDALVMSTMSDVCFRDMLAVLETDDKQTYALALEFRRSTAIAEFKQVLARLRPRASLALGKLDVHRRPRRHMRHRLEKLHHPFLRLALCQPGGEEDLRLSDEQWAAILPYTWHIQVGPQTLRADIDAATFILRAGISWPQLPERFGRSTGNSARRFEGLMTGATFPEMTRVLLRLEGLLGPDETIEVPAVVHVPKSKR